MAAPEACVIGAISGLALPRRKVHSARDARRLEMSSQIETTPQTLNPKPQTVVHGALHRCIVERAYRKRNVRRGGAAGSALWRGNFLNPEP